MSQEDSGGCSKLLNCYNYLIHLRNSPKACNPRWTSLSSGQIAKSFEQSDRFTETYHARVGSDNRINSLCNRLLASSSDEEVAALASELKVALHEHMESLRTQLKDSLQRHPSDEYGSRRPPRSD